jgi:hypothetical protein
MDGKPVLADQPIVTFGGPLFAPSWRAAWKWYTYDLQQICQFLLPLGIVAAATVRTKQLSLRAERIVIDGC